MVLLFIIIPLESQVILVADWKKMRKLMLFPIDMSLAVPITNSLTFIFSLLTGLFLGESIGGKGKKKNKEYLNAVP